MKLLFMFACAALIGCGVIFGLVHATVPHLVAPQLLPQTRAAEPDPVTLTQTVATAGRAVRTGVDRAPYDLVADGR